MRKIESLQKHFKVTLELKILIVSPFFSPIIGGVESVLETTCLALSKSGHSVRVLTSSTGVRMRKGIRKNGFEIDRSDALVVPDDSIISPSKFDYEQVALAMKGVLEEFDPAVIHFHNYQMRNYSMFLNSFLSAIDRSKYVTANTIHNDTGDPFSHYVLSYLPLDQVVTVTRRSAVELVSGGVPSSKVTYIPNMIDVDKYRNADGTMVRKMLGVEQNCPLILFPSRLVGREGNLLLDSSNGKGFEVLLGALPEIVEQVPNVRVLMLGNDAVFQEKVSKAKERVREIALKIGAQDTLVYLDEAIPNEMLPRVFVASDIVVSLSVKETFGMVFLEGMAAGKPVVGVNTLRGGVPEVVPDGVAGLLVPENDAHSTAKAIIRILLDDELKAQLGLNGIKWCKRRYDIKAVLPKLLDMYQQQSRRKISRQENLESLPLPKKSLSEGIN